MLVVYDYEESWLPSGLLLLSFGCYWGLDDLASAASAFLGWLRCIPLQLVLAAVAVKKSVAQTLKWYLSFMKVSVVEVAILDHHILLPCFKCC